MNGERHDVVPRACIGTASASNCRQYCYESMNIVDVAVRSALGKDSKIVFMALTSWKAFKFFETSEVKFPDAESSSLFAQGVISCVCTGSDNIFLGGHDGSVRILSRTFKIVRTFLAHESGFISHMKQVEGTALLVTIAETLSSEPVLKVWAVDKVDRKTGIPRCQFTLTIQNGRKTFPISAFAALADLSQLAVGFANGAVTVVRGDLIHDRGAKQRTVFESEEPVTGIQFREGNTTALYIATTAKILTLVISGRGQGQPARTLDDKGCAAGCMTIDKATRDVIVARNDAIYYYGLHGRGASYNCDGQKTLVTMHKDYVILVYPSASSSISRSTLGNYGADQAIDPHKTSTLTILNTDFHFIALTEALPSQITTCFEEWGDLFALTVDGKLYRYHEKTLQHEFELLFQRNLYILAIQMAKKAGVDAAQQNVIFRKYGDYLYQKKDYDTAMQQYLKAIDNTEPSQVIRKFLDTQRIHNLIDYLEELHEHHKASSDHTILLLNCYAKLKDVEKLEQFIKGPGDQRFDLDTAIAMCRQGGYFDQAAYLARKHSEHDLVISILIEDSKKYAEALAYIWRLEPESAFHNFSKYATVLLEHCATDATQIFIDYYTSQFRPKKDAVVVTAAAASQSSGFVPSAVQNLAALLPLPSMSLDYIGEKLPFGQKTQTHVVEAENTDPPPKYDVPKPRGAFSAFVDHPNEFVKFLEACMHAESLQRDDKVDIYTALFEMYLHKANEQEGDEKRDWEDKAKQLIGGKDVPIDTSNVLLLSDLSRFRAGTTLVREQQGLRFDIFRSYTTANDTAGAIKALRKYGPDEPQLYPAALAYFASSSRALEEAGEEFDVVLKKIDEDGLMAPLQVIQTLSNNQVATIGLVKRYLQNTIGKEREEIANNRRIITAFRADTSASQAKLTELTTTPAVFTATRCSACGYALDMPTVHFMCKHSFHQRCLNTADGESVESVECPLCAPANATVRAIRKAQEEAKGRHEVFKEALGRSRDGFGTVAEWFGRGVMGGTLAGGID